MADEATYEELLAQRQREWQEKQQIAAKNLRELHERIAEMPDVKHAPDPDQPFEAKGVQCEQCTCKWFEVKRWVTVNGQRHRAELACLDCGHVSTWDWQLSEWLG